MSISTLSNQALLQVENLKVSFRTDEGLIKAVDGIDFAVKQGQTLGIVGESGSGKSVTTLAIMQLLPQTGLIDEASSIQFERKDGQVVEIMDLKATDPQMRQIRGGEIGLIFQEPMASFSPVYTVGNHLTEAIRQHRPVKKKEAREMGINLLEKAGIANPKQCFKQYPFELSGGMRQRAMIALALCCNPSLLIADEPTTALDVTIQAQILALMDGLKNEFDMSIIFITHDLGVIAQIADDIVVMYLGRIMERGKTREIINTSHHPYTQSLLKAIPKLQNLGKRLVSVGGNIPSPLERPRGCPFYTRCPDMIPNRCDQHDPSETKISQTHAVRCYLYE